MIDFPELVLLDSEMGSRWQVSMHMDIDKDITLLQKKDTSPISPFCLPDKHFSILLYNLLPNSSHSLL